MNQLYFFSDSNDLVQYISQELKYDNNQSFIISGNNNNNNNNNSIRGQKRQMDVISQAFHEVQKLNIVARKDVATIETVHIDKQKGREPSAYYGTFIDLYLAIRARVKSMVLVIMLN